jgi:hypothetical protein
VTAPNKRRLVADVDIALFEVFKLKVRQRDRTIGGVIEDKMLDYIIAATPSDKVETVARMFDWILIRQRR